MKEYILKNFLSKEFYNQYSLLSLTRYGWIKLSPIVQNSSLLPLESVWAVSQSQCG